MTLHHTASATPTLDRPAARRADLHQERPSPWARLTRGLPDAPRWERPALLGLLVATGVLYLVDLGASGWANSFYSAAVQAGSVSWKAFLFGSSDAENAVTVDKPPASLWVMARSVRVFGLSSWAVLVPQALMGVATVGVLHAAVRRHSSAGTALLAGAVLALTPVAALMFRFNNPDALLVLLMTGAAYAVVRAVDDGRTRWLVLAGALVGVGFLTKQLQVFLAVPALAGAHLLTGPVRLRRRLGQLLAAGAAVLVTAGWWVALVELWPASSRPYIGGSTDNSFLGLTLGYNGLGRLTGSETGSVVAGGTAGTGGMWGQTGIARLFTADFGGQITWLVPAALLLGAVALVLLRRRPRTDGQRAQVVLWLTWLVVTGVTSSLMAGIFHAYYTVALAPAVAGLVATAAGVVWQRRSGALALGGLALATAATAVWSFVLLSRSSTFLPWLSWLVLVAGVLAAVGLVATLVRPSLARSVAVVALAASLAGPAACTVQTVSTAHTGSIVSAGPAVVGAMGGPGGMGGHAPGGQPPAGALNRAGGFRGGAGGMGGLLGGSTPSAALTALLEADAGSSTWVAATVGANNASGYQLATQEPVMPIGGSNGTDPSPTLAEFQAGVAAGKVHYFIAGGATGGGPGGAGGSTGTSSAITSWVQAHFTAQTVGGVTLYDLTSSTTA